MKTRTLVRIALLSAILVISKEIIAFLPNIELVSFLLILFSINLKLKESLLISIVFCLIEIVLYGTGPWSIGYLIIWPSLIIVTYLLRNKLNTEFKLAFYSMFFGFIFGFLFAIPYFIISLNLGLSFWLKGTVFDVVHGLGNFIIMLILYKPINSLISSRIVE